MASFWTEMQEWYSSPPTGVKVLCVLGGGGLAAVGGVFAAPFVGAAASAVGLGAAGGTLSGAAASSAGLAWLGGGSVAAGGLGVAGGTAVVGAGSAAVGTGFVGGLSHYADKQGSESRENLKSASDRKVSGSGIHYEE